MAKLTTKGRNALPAKDFAEPKERKYPIEDAAHRKNAKARASEMENKGDISKREESKIDAKASSHGNAHGPAHSTHRDHDKFLHHITP